MINNLAIQQLNQQNQYQNVPVNGTTNELQGHVQQQDDKSVISNVIAQAPLPPVPVRSGMSKTSKILIIVGVSVAFLIIFGILLGILIVTLQKNKYDYPGAMISTPPQYANFEKIINQGQKDNLIKLRNIPRVELCYNYTSIHNQTNFQLNNQDGKEQAGISTILNITHNICLMTTDVTEKNFVMLLYFQNSQIQESGKLIGKFSGFSEMYEQEEKLNKARRLQSQKTESNNNENKDQDQSNVDQFTKSKISNEFSPLTEIEKEILLQNGITEENYNVSNYPIIKFVVAKDGSIEKIYLPVNIRYDILQVYLSILEQIIPRLSQDIYNVMKDTGLGGKRVLKQRSRILEIQALSGDKVQPIQEAHVEQGNNKASLKTTYTVQEQYNNKAERQIYHQQSSFVELNGLVSSEVKSVFKLQSNEEDQSQKLFEKVKLDSSIRITFAKKVDDVGEEFLNKLNKAQSRMTRLVINWEEAINSYTQSNSQSQLFLQQQEQYQQEKDKQKRQLQSNQKMGEKIIKQIASTNLGPVQLTSNFVTECYQGENSNQEDFCKVAIEMGAQNAQFTAFSTDVKFNVSKLLKYYEFLVSLLDGKLAKLNETLKSKVITIKTDIENILNRIEDFIALDKNPILKEITPLITEDSLGVFQLIQDVETAITTILQNLNQLIARPLQKIQDRTLQFLNERNSKLADYVKSIKDFVVQKYQLIMKFIDDYKQNGITKELVAMVKTTLDQYDAQIKKIIDDQVTVMIEQAKKVIEEKSQQIADPKILIEKAGKIAEDKLGSVIGQQVKDFLISQGIQDKISQSINKVIQSVADKTNAQGKASSVIFDQIMVVKQQLIEKIEKQAALKIANTGNPDPNKLQAILNDIKDINKNVSGSQIFQGLDQFKQDIQKTIDELKELFGKDLKKNLIDYTIKLFDIPDQLLTTALKQAKDVSSKVVEKSINIKDNVIQWGEDVKKSVLVIGTEVKSIIEELKDIIKSVNPDDSQLTTNNNSVQKDLENVFNRFKEYIQTAKDGKNEFSDILVLVNRFKDLRTKFSLFIKDLKEFGSKVYDRYLNVKISVLNVSKEGQALYDTIVSQFKKAKESFNNGQKRILQVNLDQLSDLFQQVVSQVQGASDLSQLIGPIVNQDKELIKKQLIEKAIILAKDLEIKKQFNPQIPSFKQGITVKYPTPIGVAVDLILEFNAKPSLQLDLAISQGILTLQGNASCQVRATGAVGANFYLAEIGVEVSGIVFDPALSLKLDLQILNKFAGGIKGSLQLAPIQFSISFYYTSIFNLDGLKCIEKKGKLGRQLDAWKTIKDGVNTITNNVADGAKNAYNFVKDKSTEIVTNVKTTVQFVSNWCGNAPDKIKQYIEKLTLEDAIEISKCVVSNVTSPQRLPLGETKVINLTSEQKLDFLDKRW